MGQAAVQKTERPSVKKPPRGIIGTIRHWLVLDVLVVMLAWLFLVVGFGLYQIVRGMDQTNSHMNAIVQTTATVLAKDQHFLVENGYSAFQAGEKELLKVVLVQTHALELWQWVGEKTQRLRQEVAPQTELQTPKASGIAAVFQQHWHKVWYSLGSLVLGVTVIVLMRGAVFVLALPVFLLMVGLGLVDGLVRRDVRKFQAARESTYLFHRLRNTGKPCFFVPLFAYFVCPLAISPLWFLLPMAIVLGGIVQLSVQLFKKYL